MSDTPRTDDATYTHLGSNDHGANLKLKKAVPAALSKELESENADLKRQLEEAQKLQVRLYNTGYESGHHDTVESVFCPIHISDIDTIHADIVDEIVTDAATAATKPKSGWKND